MAKQKNVLKRSTRMKATKPDERLYHGISTIMSSTFTKSTFYKNKNKLIEDFCKYVTSIENRGLKVEKSGWATLVKTRNFLYGQRIQTGCAIIPGTKWNG
jgi:hypothetical protein